MCLSLIQHNFVLKIQKGRKTTGTPMNYYGRWKLRKECLRVTRTTYTGAQQSLAGTCWTSSEPSCYPLRQISPFFIVEEICCYALAIILIVLNPSPGILYGRLNEIDTWSSLMPSTLLDRSWSWKPRLRASWARRSRRLRDSNQRTTDRIELGNLVSINK